MVLQSPFIGGRNPTLDWLRPKLINAFCTYCTLCSCFNYGFGPILVYLHQSWSFNRKREFEEIEKPSDPYGLEVVLDLPTKSMTGEVVNIVFVHGLGGSARGTWTYEPGSKFWPLWLHDVEGLENTRVMTFGYDANWHKFGNPSDISDFGTQLLDQLFLHYSKYPKDKNVNNAIMMHPLMLDTDYICRAQHGRISSQRGTIFIGVVSHA